MFKMPGILWNSFKMALGELKNNKLRTFLSLFGITIGIFCIIGVLATVNSLEQKVQSDIKTLGANTIYIDKWQYGEDNGGSYPWWKYINRPVPRKEEVEFIKAKSSLVYAAAHFLSTTANVSYKNIQLNGCNIYGITEDYNKIQSIDLIPGSRYLSDADFKRGTAVSVIGYQIAEDLFGNPQYAPGRKISLNGKKVQVIGVIKKEGTSLTGGFNYDNSCLLSYHFYASMFDPRSQFGNNFIMVQGKPGVSSKLLSEELRGVMRQLRRLSPTQEDNFALNDINMFSEQIGAFFGMVNLGGWLIAGLSLIVGGFGVANIMFVTVRERTSQIGLKKAIGAKKGMILTEFLLESAFLCLIGGLTGLGLVAGAAAILSNVLPFPIFISGGIIVLAFSICIVLGILSGIIPAFIAAKMDPVVAIRTK